MNPQQSTFLEITAELLYREIQSRFWSGLALCRIIKEMMPSLSHLIYPSVSPSLIVDLWAHWRLGLSFILSFIDPFTSSFRIPAYQRDAYTPVFIAAWFRVAEKVRNSQSVHRQMVISVVCLYNRVCSALIRRGNSDTHNNEWNLEMEREKEISQLQKDKRCVISYIQCT